MMELNNKNIRFLSLMGAQGVLGQSVLDLAKDGMDFYGVSADLGVASGFERFYTEFPEKYVNVGIAEQNMIAVAAGLAKDNTPVIATTWSAFATYRCADQIRNFMGFMGMNIKVIGIGSGLHIAKFGGSHYGIGDVGLIRSIPDLTIVAPADGVSIYTMMRKCLEYKGPVYVRLTGGERLPIIYKNGETDFEIGKGIEIKQGQDIVIISNGAVLEQVLKAEQLLKEAGISCTVVDMHTIKPLDTELLSSYLNKKLIVTVEEHSIIGGLGSAVAEYLSHCEDRPRHLMIGIDDFVPKAGEYSYLLEQCGLLPEQIAGKIEQIYKGD